MLLCVRNTVHSCPNSVLGFCTGFLGLGTLIQVFAGLLFGAMLPYWFSAMTMKSVGKAALAMVEEVRRQFNTIAGALAEL